MGAPPDTGPQPRSEADAAYVQRFDHVMRLPLVASALLPLIVVPEPGKPVSVFIGIATWLVFVVDYVVHRRRLRGFAQTGFGRFDLFVTVVTAPWFLLPGAGGGGFVVLLRLARVARLVMASRSSRQLFARLGRVAGVALGVLITASLVAYYAEHPTNPEFATVGDALWWGIVTLTTVGYGDIVPKTTTGRWAAVVVMVTGIAVLGLLAGSLASFLRLEKEDNGSPDTDPDAPGAGPDGVATERAGLDALVAEIAAVRQQLTTLTEQVGKLGNAVSTGDADGAPDPGPSR